jgi:hypothetical protein
MPQIFADKIKKNLRQSVKSADEVCLQIRQLYIFLTRKTFFQTRNARSLTRDAPSLTWNAPFQTWNAPSLIRRTAFQIWKTTVQTSNAPAPT